MRCLTLKNLPRYECLIEASKQFAEMDPSACLAFLHLLRLGDEVIHHSETYFAKHGLSQGRFTVLMQLFRKADNDTPPRTPAELADLTGVTRATMTGLIDTLERDCLVKREPDPDDRRMMFVHLTERGRQALLKVLPGQFAYMAQLMGPLSETERETLVRLLTKILQATKDFETAQAAT